MLEPDAVAGPDELEAAGCEAELVVGFAVVSVGASDGALDAVGCEAWAGLAAALYDRTILLVCVRVTVTHCGPLGLINLKISMGGGGGSLIRP